MSEELIVARLARELGLRTAQVQATVELLDAGNTVPFISRYRKEATGELDETQVRNLQERLTYLRNLAAKKAEVIRLIDEQGKLTPELAQAINAAEKLTEVEDLYRPYRPKRRTRASVAREKGLEPLAERMLAQADTAGDPAAIAAAFINEEKGVATAEEALAGARDIIAETISDDAHIRRITRELTSREGVIAAAATGKGGEAAQEFEMYADFSERLATLPPHRVLAINRGERLECLSVKLHTPDQKILLEIQSRYVKQIGSIWSPLVAEACDDGHARLIAPAIEREVRAEQTERAEERAIALFAENLRHLLLQPPIRGFRVLGIDPGFRTGCKLALVDDTGKVLETGATYITLGDRQRAEGEEVLIRLLNKHKVGLIAIGNGTASRETEQVVAGILPRLQHECAYVIVSEAGASVYSASKLATEEFPQFDVTIRGAISIARRTQDPLAELVKIDPKSIGVGQYQHDVDQKRLAEQLGAVVESAVNSVGVDLNTASPTLLQHVAGIKATVARAIVEYREANGRFHSRAELKKVSGLGPKAFEQCAGFLRVPGGKEPLDNTAVHPESYHIAEAVLQAVGATRQQIIGQGAGGLHDALRSLSPEQVARELGAGLPTVRDIFDSLAKPGRDPRDELPKPIFHTEVLKLEDLQVGMELTGTVRNVVDFGAFVDIGVHEDGLVHVSELANRFVKHPSQVVAVGDVVRVRVLSVDLKRQRIGLSMKLDQLAGSQVVARIAALPAGGGGGGGGGAPRHGGPVPAGPRPGASKAVAPPAAARPDPEQDLAAKLIALKSQWGRK